MSSIHSSGATAMRPAKSLAGIAWRFRGIVLPLALISGVINLLYLSGSLFMLEVYDRVMPSRSIPTLVGLLLFLAVLFGFQAVLEIVRSRVLVRLGSAATTGLGTKAFALGVTSAATGSSGASAKHLQDVEQLRRFLSGPGPTALFDLPWMPIYLGLCFVFHPLIGIVASLGALVLVSLTVLSDRLTEHYARTGRSPSLRRDETADMARRNAEVVIAMGMLERISARWERAGGAALGEMQRGADVTATLGALSKIMRMALQSLVLAVGAYLAIMGEASSGIMIASSILTARALAPVEQAIANWRGLVSARQSWRDLMQCLPTAQAQTARVALPAPRRSLSVEHLSSSPGKDLPPIIRDVSFKLDCGDGLGIVGRSGSGKSSLLRSLLGVWTVNQGSIRLDGATIDQWPDTIRGAHLGYLPQDIELFAGTVAENISRFDEEAESTAIIAAARQADIHELILSLPNGYETEAGEGGAALSAGQRQRIALARALYGNPFLVVLDEPNSNLDAEGEVALNATIRRVRERGGIVIVVAHRPSALAELNLVMVMNAGQVHDFGPKDEVLGRLTRPTASAGSVTSPSRGNLIDRMAS